MSQNVVFIQSANLDDLPLASMLSSSLLSEQVKIQAEQFVGVRQQQFVACRFLLAELLNQYFDIASLPTIIIGDNRRPKFEKKNLPDFNISHSHHHVAVALATQGQIGLDIEFKRARKNYLAIAQQFFSPQENIWLNQQHDSLDAFWQLWTLRESALKLYAKGVWQMKELAITMPNQQISAQFATHFHSYHQQLDDLYVSVCCRQPIHSIAINQ